MKNITWKQLKGLGWFCIVYALSRLLLSLPALALQETSMFAIFFGVMTGAWLVFTAYRSNQALLGLSVSVLVALAFIWLSWGDFGVVGMGIGMAGLALATLVTSVVLIINRINKKKEWLIPLLLHGIGTVVLILLMEYLVLPVIY